MTPQEAHSERVDRLWRTALDALRILVRDGVHPLLARPLGKAIRAIEQVERDDYWARTCLSVWFTENKEGES